jgi:tetratricopeptide (TPR) repeat protein
MLLIETLLLLREGALTADALGRATARTQALRQPTYERTLLHIAGQWHQADARHVDAVEAYTRAIEMARAVGLRDTGAEAGRGLSLARLGRRPEAEDAAATAEHDSLHATVAELYLALEDHAKARHHAISGYKFSWADGPPYTFHWELQTCRTVLQALNESEPQLPPYDPTNIAPIKFEADIRRLLAEHAAKPKPPQT